MKFALKAVNPTNGVVALELDANDEAGARDAARHRGLTVIALKPRNALAGLRPARRATFPVTLFSIELLALLEAGLNIVEALQTLVEKEPRGSHRSVLVGLSESLHRGESLSQAVAALPQVFSALYVATIQASERTGDLAEALKRYIAYQQELDTVRKKAVAALLYPAILSIVGSLVLGFLLFYVIPRFARVYEDISAGLPFFSGLLLSVGRGIEHHRAFIALSALTVAGVSTYALSRPAARVVVSCHLWRLPVVGEKMKVYQLARFYRTVSMLLRAGIPALKSLEMVSGLLTSNLRAQLSNAIRDVEEGKPISKSLTAAGLATPVATRMMAVGERSGQIGELMERIARFYDDEISRFVDTATRVIEPTLMAALGIAVGLVVVLMYMPIFELAGAVQ